jgi:predicted RND superfamily exporter protein
MLLNMDKGNKGQPQSMHRGQRYLSWLLTHQKRVQFVALLVTCLALLFALKLYLKPSFSSLLPETLPSVVQLNKVMDEVGGTGLLLIGVESPSFSANREFVSALGAELEKLPRTEIREVEYHFKDTREYVEKFGLYYLNLEELTLLKDKLERDVAKNLEKKKDSMLSGFLGLDDDSQKVKETKTESKATVTDGGDVFKNIDSRVRNLLEYPDDYLGSSDGKFLVISVRTAGSSLSIGEAKKFTTKVQNLISEISPAKFHPEMAVNFAGNVQRSIDEVEAVRHDIVDTALLLIALILLCLYLFFQSVTLVLLLAANLVVALIWTLGFGQVSVGYLNTLTAFMSSLVVGTGINYSCIVISRFLEERRRGGSTFESVTLSVSSTVLPTLAGSATTAAAFLALILANNRGFSEFALIGGVGIVFCWIATYLLLPIWLFNLDSRFSLSRSTQKNADWVGRALASMTRWTLTYPKTVSLVLFVLTLGAAWTSKSFFEDPYEYDFRKLGNKQSHAKSGASAMQWRIQEEVYKSSLTPGIVLLENSKQGENFCRTVRTKIEELPPSSRNFQGCLSLYEILPRAEALNDETNYKKEIRNEVKALLGHRMFKFSDSKLAEIFLAMNQKTAAEPPTLNDLPYQMRKKFQDKAGNEGRLAFIYSDIKRPLEDGRNLLNYTQAFGHIDLPSELGTVRAAGENFVLADLLRSIQMDGPRVSLVAFVAVLILGMFIAGGIKAGLVMAFCLVVPTIWMFALQAVMGVKFNFINFIALPLTFGIGVDYSINLFARLREQKFKNLPGAVRSTGAAVLLCSLTTIIGYLTLFEATNQALISFAKLALIGEVVCLIGAFIAMPLLMLGLEKIHFFDSSIRDRDEESAQSEVELETKKLKFTNRL